MLISAIVPAYNEEDTVEGVISTIRASGLVDEIIVVSDGSSDKTAALARKSGAHVLELPHNHGKGGAIKKGFEVCSGQVILLLDADLIGFRTEHIAKLLAPVLDDNCDMSIGLFNSGRLATDLAQKISPQLSGQRALKRELLDSISNIEDTGYGIEMALTIQAEKQNCRVCEVFLEDLTHVTKEEKLGLARGFLQRIKMYWQIVRGARLARR
jgi:glycosyltransferase involved in cell wall biosynthesis